MTVIDLTGLYSLLEESRRTCRELIYCPPQRVPPELVHRHLTSDPQTGLSVGNPAVVIDCMIRQSETEIQRMVSSMLAAEQVNRRHADRLRVLSNPGCSPSSNSSYCCSPFSQDLAATAAAAAGCGADSCCHELDLVPQRPLSPCVAPHRPVAPAESTPSASQSGPGTERRVLSSAVATPPVPPPPPPSVTQIPPAPSTTLHSRPNKHKQQQQQLRRGPVTASSVRERVRQSIARTAVATTGVNNNNNNNSSSSINSRSVGVFTSGAAAAAAVRSANSQRHRQPRHSPPPVAPPSRHVPPPAPVRPHPHPPPSHSTSPPLRHRATVGETAQFSWASWIREVCAGDSHAPIGHSTRVATRVGSASVSTAAATAAAATTTATSVAAAPVTTDAAAAATMTHMSATLVSLSAPRILATAVGHSGADNTAPYCHHQQQRQQQQPTDPAVTGHLTADVTPRPTDSLTQFYCTHSLRQSNTHRSGSAAPAVSAAKCSWHQHTDSSTGSAGVNTHLPGAHTTLASASLAPTSAAATASTAATDTIIGITTATFTNADATPAATTTTAVATTTAATTTAAAATTTAATTTAAATSTAKSSHIGAHIVRPSSLTTSASDQLRPSMLDTQLRTALPLLERDRGVANTYDVTTVVNTISGAADDGAAAGGGAGGDGAGCATVFALPSGLDSSVDSTEGATVPRDTHVPPLELSSGSDSSGGGGGECAALWCASGSQAAAGAAGDSLGQLWCVAADESVATGPEWRLSGAAVASQTTTPTSTSTSSSSSSSRSSRLCSCSRSPLNSLKPCCCQIQPSGGAAGGAGGDGDDHCCGDISWHSLTPPSSSLSPAAPHVTSTGRRGTAAGVPAAASSAVVTPTLTPRVCTAAFKLFQEAVAYSVKQHGPLAASVFSDKYFKSRQNTPRSGSGSSGSSGSVLTRDSAASVRWQTRPASASLATAANATANATAGTAATTTTATATAAAAAAAVTIAAATTTATTTATAAAATTTATAAAAAAVSKPVLSSCPAHSAHSDTHNQQNVAAICDSNISHDCGVAPCTGSRDQCTISSALARDTGTGLATDFISNTTAAAAALASVSSELSTSTRAHAVTHPSLSPAPPPVTKPVCSHPAPATCRPTVSPPAAAAAAAAASCPIERGELVAGDSLAVASCHSLAPSLAPSLAGELSSTTPSLPATPVRQPYRPSLLWTPVKLHSLPSLYTGSPSSSSDTAGGRQLLLAPYATLSSASTAAPSTEELSEGEVCVYLPRSRQLVRTGQVLRDGRLVCDMIRSRRPCPGPALGRPLPAAVSDGEVVDGDEERTCTVSSSVFSATLGDSSDDTLS